MTDKTTTEKPTGKADAKDDDGPVEGDLVVVRHQDLTSGVGADVERYGVVVERLEQEGSGPAVRVAYLDEPTAPIPLDHTVHNRDDAPRVELAGT